MIDQTLLINTFLTAYGPVINKYNFVIINKTSDNVLLMNDDCKILAVGDRFLVDVYIMDRSERYKFNLQHVFEFLLPEIDTDKMMKDCQHKEDGTQSSEMSCQAFFLNKYGDRIFIPDLPWKDDLQKEESLQYKLRKFIMETFHPGHDLYYLMNSGRGWPKAVLAYLDLHKIAHKF